MSLTLSFASKYRLLSLGKTVRVFLTKCKNDYRKILVRVPPRSVSFLNLNNFYSTEFNETSNSNSEVPVSESLNSGRNVSVYKLQDILKCTRKEASSLLKIPGLASSKESELLEIVDLLKSKGISLANVFEYPWLLTLTPDGLERRVSLIYTIGLENINDAVPLMKLALPRLLGMCSLWQHESDWFAGSSRIHYISRELQCPVSVVCQMMVKYSFLRRLPASRLTKNVELMISAGVSPSNILKDSWSLRTKCEMVEQRLGRAKEAGLPVLKPWLVRCQETIFQRTLERHVQSHALLGSKSFYEFLADRLNCDVQTVEVMTARYPNILHVNVPKINEIVDFLQDEGFSVEQIQQVPRILCHGLETTRARLQQLQALGFNPVSLMVLCQSQHDYHKMLHKLEQRKARVAL